VWTSLNLYFPSGRHKLCLFVLCFYSVRLGSVLRLNCCCWWCCTGEVRVVVDVHVWCKEETAAGRTNADMHARWPRRGNVNTVSLITNIIIVPWSQKKLQEHLTSQKIKPVTVSRRLRTGVRSQTSGWRAVSSAIICRLGWRLRDSRLLLCLLLTCGLVM